MEMNRDRGSVLGFRMEASVGRGMWGSMGSERSAVRAEPRGPLGNVVPEATVELYFRKGPLAAAVPVEVYFRKGLRGPLGVAVPEVAAGAPRFPSVPRGGHGGGAALRPRPGPGAAGDGGETGPGRGARGGFVSPGGRAGGGCRAPLCGAGLGTPARSRSVPFPPGGPSERAPLPPPADGRGADGQEGPRRVPREGGEETLPFPGPGSGPRPGP